jgi:large subunit ribosomal protein L23
MDLSLQEVIQGVVVSSKAQQINAGKSKLFLRVHTAANKVLVKEAIEKLFEVKVSSVRILNRKGKNRFVRRRLVTGSLEKRAIVTLKEGYQVDVFGQSEVGTSDASAVTRQEK